MCSPDIGENSNVGAYHGCEVLHLTPSTNPCFDDGKRMLPIHLPERKCNTELRIEALGATDNIPFRREQLKKPIFHDGLAIAPGYRQNWIIKLRPMGRGKTLQSTQGIFYNQEIGIHILIFRGMQHICDDKVSHALGICMCDIIMAIPGPTDCKEKCILDGMQLPAVISKCPNADIRIPDKLSTCTNNSNHFRDGIQFLCLHTECEFQHFLESSRIFEILFGQPTAYEESS